MEDWEDPPFHRVHRLLGFSYPFSNFLTKQNRVSKAKQNITKHEKSLKCPHKMFENRNNSSFKSDWTISDLRSISEHKIRKIQQYEKKIEHLGTSKSSYSSFYGMTPTCYSRITFMVEKI